MKRAFNYILPAVLLALLGSCDKEADMKPTADEPIRFEASVRQAVSTETRAFGDGEDGSIIPLPYVNEIFVRKIVPGEASVADLTVSPYNVMTANKGVLEYAGIATDALKWDQTYLSEAVDFYAWTQPTGVDIAPEATTGTVNFVAGNTYNSGAGDKDKFDGSAVTPLEVFISASSLGDTYSKNPAVNLPFQHQTAKLSILLRNWLNQTIQKGAIGQGDATIRFLSLPDVWTVEQTEEDAPAKTAFRITDPATSSTDDLELDFKNLYFGESRFTMYLPPMDFSEYGDFCITYGGSEFYGTLSGIPNISELNAGEHMAVTLDLNINYGVGVGAYINDWKGPVDDHTAWANPHKGIYSTEGWSLLVAAVQAGDLSLLPDSLYTDEGGQKFVRLYRNLEITDAALLGVGTSANPFAGLTLDGQGYTITIPDGNKSLLGEVGKNGVTTEILNLNISAGAITDVQGILAGNINSTTLLNCHVLSGSLHSGDGASVGSLAGDVTDSQITYCTSTAFVTGASTTGGLVGSLNVNSILTGCFVRAKVNGSDAGGLVGNNKGTINNSVFWTDGDEATVTGTTAGLLVGSNGGTVENCYWRLADGITTDAIGSGTGTNISGFNGSETGYAFDSTPVDVSATSYDRLIPALNAGTGKNWVFVYGKDFPVMEKQ